MVRNIIKQSLFFIVFSLGILFFFLISAKASTTGFPEDWSFKEYVCEGELILWGYSGSSRTIVIEAPIEFNGHTYNNVQINGDFYSCFDSEELVTKGKVYYT